MRRIIERVVPVVTTTTWKISWETDPPDSDHLVEAVSNDLRSSGVFSETAQNAQPLQERLQHLRVACGRVYREARAATIAGRPGHGRADELEGEEVLEPGDGQDEEEGAAHRGHQGDPPPGVGAGDDRQATA